MHINDSHCHFFSTDLFAALARQRLGPQRPPPPGSLREAMEEDVSRQMAIEVCDELGWEVPGSAWTLANPASRAAGTNCGQRSASSFRSGALTGAPSR